MHMVKETHHPNAYLKTIKNVKLGLRTRTRILNALGKSTFDARSLARETGTSYPVAMHHLRLLNKEGIVDKTGGKPYSWWLTGRGQKRLLNST